MSNPSPRRGFGAVVLWLLIAWAAPYRADANGGPLGIDHEWALDRSGIWAQKYQNALQYGVIAAELGGGIYLGKDDPLGQTFWQSVDSTAISTVGAEILKFAFSRSRPSQGGDPNKWFQGSCCASFPSGEVTVQA